MPGNDIRDQIQYLYNKNIISYQKLKKMIKSLEWHDMITENVIRREYQRYGYWILDDYGTAKCLACEEWYEHGPTNYCPNCGAKMIGVEKWQDI